LQITEQNCVKVCPGSLHVSANNTALGNQGSSAALAINHPLTVLGWEGGNRPHVLAAPLYPRCDRGGRSFLRPRRAPPAGDERRVLPSRPGHSEGRGAGGEQGWRFCRRHATSHGANQLPGERPLRGEALGKRLKHAAIWLCFPLHPPPSCSAGSCSPLTSGPGGLSSGGTVPVGANAAVPAQRRGARPTASLRVVPQTPAPWPGASVPGHPPSK